MLENSVIKWASINGYFDLVKLLLNAGINAEVNNCGIKWASENGHTDVVNELIQARGRCLWRK